MKSLPRNEGKSVATDAQALRHCLGRFATGVAVASYDAVHGDPRGLTVNSFTSVSLDPPLVLICLHKRSKAIEHLPGAPFGVSILGVDQQHLARHFAGKSTGEAPAWRYVGGVPLLERSLAWMACDPWSNHEAGDHVIIVGRVRDFGADQQDPLCFYRGAFVGVAPSAPDESTRAKEAAE